MRLRRRRCRSRSGSGVSQRRLWTGDVHGWRGGSLDKGRIQDEHRLMTCRSHRAAPATIHSPAGLSDGFTLIPSSSSLDPLSTCMASAEQTDESHPGRSPSSAPVPADVAWRHECRQAERGDFSSSPRASSPGSPARRFLPEHVDDLAELVLVRYRSIRREPVDQLRQHVGQGLRCILLAQVEL